MTQKILIAIPAFNEEKTIASVISDIKSNGYKNILIVNDGSFDKTLQKSIDIGVMVVSHFKNCGLGVGIRTAIKFAQKNNFDILVTFDADGQHDAGDIKKIINPILQNKADVVVGIRNLANKNVPYFRKIILYLSNCYTWLLFGIWSCDSQSGFRALSVRAIQLINLQGERMEVSSEIFSEIKKHNLKYTEVPIKVIYTKYSLSKGQKNSNLFKVGFKLFLRLFK